MDWQALQGKILLGIGIDLIEIARIREAHRKHGDRFLQRVFTDQELDYCLAKRDPAPSLAARWAAKEAAAKALGLGLGRHLQFRDLSVHRLPSGQPILLLSESAQERLGNLQLLLSLSHHDTTATAIVAYVGQTPHPHPQEDCSPQS